MALSQPTPFSTCLAKVDLVFQLSVLLVTCVVFIYRAAADIASQNSECRVPKSELCVQDSGFKIEYASTRPWMPRKAHLTMLRNALVSGVLVSWLYLITHTCRSSMSL